MISELRNSRFYSLINDKKENVRRKHNYIPMILEMLKISAKRGDLKQLISAAVEKEKDIKTKKEAN